MSHVLVAGGGMISCTLRPVTVVMTLIMPATLTSKAAQHETFLAQSSQ